MFVAKLDKAEPLKRLVNILTDIVSSVEWVVDCEGIHIHTMNISHTCVVDVTIPVSAFKTFTCDENTVLNIPLANLSKIIKCISNDQSIYIHVESNNEMLLFFHDKADNAREFRLSLLSRDDDENAILELPSEDTYSLEKKIDAEEFNTLVKEFASIGDYITIETVDNNLRFSTEGDIGCASILYKSDESVENGMRLGTYATRYLISMTKTSTATKENAYVSICLSEEKPIMLKYELMCGFGTILFFLAPKMD